MQTNKKIAKLFTHEGATAKHINAELMLRRSVMSCMLWENEFYEDGVSIADRIKALVPQVDAAKVASIAVEARTSMKLRHAPLWLCAALAKTGSLKVSTLDAVIQRADELPEFLSMYWKDGKCTISAQVKKGLARAFTKFDAYSLSKYNRDQAIKLRDVLFLCHAKPNSAEQAQIWKDLIDGTLAPPDTWESKMASGKSKKETFTDLLKAKNLGGLALLRNLRNMAESGVDEHLITEGLSTMRVDRILPFRFIAAARHAPQWESIIESSLMRCLDGNRKFTGRTVLLVDVSGSMYCPMSAKSDMQRIDAACGLGICCRELCDDIAVYSFSEKTCRVPDRRGFALRDAITGSQSHSGTYMGKAVHYINEKEKYDRLIVITDEQSFDPIPNPVGKGYMINVASNKNGVGYGAWTHLDGFSEAVLSWISEFESSEEASEREYIASLIQNRLNQQLNQQ